MELSSLRFADIVLVTPVGAIDHAGSTRLQAALTAYGSAAR